MDWLHELLLSHLTRSKLKKARDVIVERAGALDGERAFAARIIQRITEAILDGSKRDDAEADDDAVDATDSASDKASATDDVDVTVDGFAAASAVAGAS